LFYRPEKPGIAGIFWTIAFQTLYLAAIIFVFTSAALYQWCIIGLTLYIGFGTLLGFLRNQVRGRFGVEHGDLFTDVLCGVFAAPFAITQMEAHLAVNSEKKLQDEKNLPAAQTADQGTPLGQPSTIGASGTGPAALEGKPAGAGSAASAEVML